MDLNIKLEERSYGGKKFRPNTVVFHEKTNNLTLCVTPWGRTEVAEKVIENIRNFIAVAADDEELTVPYARKENLHQFGNMLRMAIIMASEKIHNQFNKEEYTAGFEIFAALQEGPQWIYVSCGQPSVTLFRKNKSALSLSQNVDLNILTQRVPSSDPLPNQLLGLGQHPPITYGNVRLQPGDRVALVSRTYLPNEFFRLDEQSFNQQEISETLANDSQETPFWLGFINVA